MSISQLNKLKSRIKHGTQVTLKFSSNFVGNYNNETKLLLANTQISKISEAFPNVSSANIKLSKIEYPN